VHGAYFEGDGGRLAVGRSLIRLVDIFTKASLCIPDWLTSDTMAPGQNLFITDVNKPQALLNFDFAF
jgi:hypothetical protein